MRINVHAGHNADGKTACGAIGLIKESTEARKVKNEVIRQLKAMGHTVYDCTVDNASNVSANLSQIVTKCNSHKVDLDVSIHFNSGANDKSGNGSTTGTEVWVYSDSSKAKGYAEKICKAIAEKGYKNRGVKYSTSLYVLRKTNSPALLVECCFVDDKDDIKAYTYQKMADAIVYGITGSVYKEKTVTKVDEEAKKTDAETATGDTSKIYRVQVGAYTQKANADALVAKLKSAGFDAVVVCA